MAIDSVRSVQNQQPGLLNFNPGQSNLFLHHTLKRFGFKLRNRKGDLDFPFCIDEFTLLSASWVIRARWRGIQRFLWKFKMMKSVHNMQFWFFPNQKICAQSCGRIKLERMAIVEIILLNKASAIHFL